MMEALSCTRGFASRSRASGALAVILLPWSSSGCAVTVRSHDVRPTGPEHTQRNSFFLWGTVGEANVSIERICGADTRAASMGVSHAAVSWRPMVAAAARCLMGCTAYTMHFASGARPAGESHERRTLQDVLGGAQNFDIGKQCDEGRWATPTIEVHPINGDVELRAARGSQHRPNHGQALTHAGRCLSRASARDHRGPREVNMRRAKGDRVLGARCGDQQNTSASHRLRRFDVRSKRATLAAPTRAAGSAAAEGAASERRHAVLSARNGQLPGASCLS